uniref:Uncharacterized protein n=1 Tax=Arundo donax TaxID=35708 RepID=A0A0A9BJJ3_ARUDO
MRRAPSSGSVCRGAAGGVKAKGLDERSSGGEGLVTRTL